MSYRLLTLGTLELYPSAPDLGLKPKDLALLVYLQLMADPQNAIETDHLHDLLWRDLDRKSTALSATLSRLRNVLGPNAIPLRSTLVYLPKPLSCDATDLIEARKRRDLRAAALVNYRGEFLKGFRLRKIVGADAWIAWAEDQRRRFRNLYLELSEEEVRDLIAERRWGDAESVISQALMHEPQWAAATVLSSEIQEGQLRREPRVEQDSVDDDAGLNAALVHAAPIADDPPRPETPTLPPIPPRKISGQRKRKNWYAMLGGGAFVIALVFTVWQAQGDPNSCRPGEAKARYVDQHFKPDVENVMPAGAQFSTGWILQNTGSCTWSRSFYLRKVRDTGAKPLSRRRQMTLPIPRIVAPNDTITLFVRMLVPATEGRFGEDWELVDRYDRHIPVDGAEPLRARIRVQHNTPICHTDSVRAEMIGKSYPDGTYFRPGTRFLQSWTVINRTKSTCAWNSQLVLRFKHADKARLSSNGINTLPVEGLVVPSTSHTFEIWMTAPQREDWYVEEWELTDLSGRVIPMEEGTRADTRIIVSATRPTRSRGRRCGAGEARAGWWNAETIRDGTPIPAGTRFVKKFTLPNIGSCVWGTGLRFHYEGSSPGEPLSESQEDIPIEREVPPNATYTFSIPMVARLPLGKHTERWSLRDERGNVVMISATPAVWTEINVTPSNTTVSAP